MKRLSELLEKSAAEYPQNIALMDLKGGRFTYAQLQETANRISRLLLKNGLLPGDRVGIYAHKSIRSVYSIFGIIHAGGAYVPVDSQSPPARNAYILNDCSVKFIVIEESFLQSLGLHLSKTPAVIEQLEDGLLLIEGPNVGPGNPDFDAKELAYILYTSGSTGTPKGVMYPQEGALAFVDWCSEVFPGHDKDIFSSHAPFHFDLSIFDLYVSLKHGACLILIDEETGKQPMLLAELISQRKISVWYSTPSVLTLLVKFGKMEKFDYPDLRLVLFAGEVFPVKHLSALKSIWKNPRFFNLYGPTETNVCTYYEIPTKIPADRTTPFPIGKSCSHVKCAVFDDSGNPITAGNEGELCVSGPIMSGYWNRPERTAAAFLMDDSGTGWYKTGDIVRQDDDENFAYVSRKDRMVKRRGFRVELGEIESAFYKHPAVTEAAAVAAQDTDGAVLIKVFLQVSDKEQASVIRMKQFAVENLPNYMIPDRFVFLSSLPKTSTDKMDYQKLVTL